MMDHLFCSFWKSPRARIVEIHKHDFYEFLVVIRGTYEYEVRHQKYVARSGDVVLYPPGLVHKEQNPPDDPPEMYLIQFNWRGMPREMPLKTNDRDGRLRMMAEWLYTFWLHRTGNWRKTREGLAHGIIAEVLRLMDNPKNELVTNAKRYIYEHLAEPLTLAILARHVHLGRSRFAHLYRKMNGITPMHDVRRIRLARARQLLQSTDSPLKTIAAKVGFAGPSSLSNALRKHHGLSPSQLRGKRRIALAKR